MPQVRLCPLPPQLSPPMSPCCLPAPPPPHPTPHTHARPLYPRPRLLYTSISQGNEASRATHYWQSVQNNLHTSNCLALANCMSNGLEAVKRIQRGNVSSITGGRAGSVCEVVTALCVAVAPPTTFSTHSATRCYSMSSPSSMRRTSAELLKSASVSTPLPLTLNYGQ